MVFEVEGGPTCTRHRVSVRTERVGRNMEAKFFACFVDWPVLAPTHWFVRATGKEHLHETLVNGPPSNLSHGEIRRFDGYGD